MVPYRTDFMNFGAYANRFYQRGSLASAAIITADTSVRPSVTVCHILMMYQNMLASRLLYRQVARRL